MKRERKNNKIKKTPKTTLLRVWRRTDLKTELVKRFAKYRNRPLFISGFWSLFWDKKPFTLFSLLVVRRGGRRLIVISDVNTVGGEYNGSANILHD